MQLLNVGCGQCYHSDWTNIDLVASGPDVRAHDLRLGLPYEDNSFDGVYHSHVLEHLSPDAAVAILEECHRVLRPGGVLRVAVPDLEGIARTYLETLDAAADQPSEIHDANHQWMTLEMIDQMTRQRGGGQMGIAMRDPDAVNQEFIKQRIGYQITGNTNAKTKRKKTIGQRVRQIFNGIRKQLALASVTLVDGSIGRSAYREGRFRQSGEIHRWMYDRVSLAALMHRIGFEGATVCTATQSQITNFDSYHLDCDPQNNIRKPDSLFMESIKPATAQAARSFSESRAA